MNLRTFLLLDVLVLFLGYTIWVVATVGYVGVFREALSSPVGIQLFADVFIALSLALVWMWRDAKTSGVPFAPYALTTLAIGSVGPLAYLLHREWKSRAPSAARRAVPA